MPGMAVRDLDGIRGVLVLAGGLLAVTLTGLSFQPWFGQDVAGSSESLHFRANAWQASSLWSAAVVLAVLASLALALAAVRGTNRSSGATVLIAMVAATAALGLCWRQHQVLSGQSAHSGQFLVTADLGAPLSDATEGYGIRRDQLTALDTVGYHSGPTGAALAGGIAMIAVVLLGLASAGRLASWDHRRGLELARHQAGPLLLGAGATAIAVSAGWPWLTVHTSWRPGGAAEVPVTLALRADQAADLWLISIGLGVTAALVGVAAALARNRSWLLAALLADAVAIGCWLRQTSQVPTTAAARPSFLPAGLRETSFPSVRRDHIVSSLNAGGGGPLDQQFASYLAPAAMVLILLVILRQLVACRRRRRGEPAAADHG